MSDVDELCEMLSAYNFEDAVPMIRQLQAERDAAYAKGIEDAAKCASEAYKRGHLEGDMEKACEPDNIASAIRALKEVK
jgi:hypothetical protein